MNTTPFNFKNHQSNSLVFLWWFKDFKISQVIPTGESSVTVTFRPRFKIIYSFLGLFYKKGFPISGYSSFRLVFIAAIVGAGYTLKKDKKDGEVIVRDFHIEYEKPVMYDAKSKITVNVKIKILKETDKYHLYEALFSIGENSQHNGITKLYYCKPNLKQFSYL
ncbi:hypothetical protein HB364_23680 [Pseudoflavitalea sp. X16]|uniref:hypothetical protein n=1 Tax=Paraflavitalea devenefica TaxID=2716334 RepID=UPI0014240407|nr:hypothetical protein [Paraflavitalea devenefica]NII28104.1 hypothetical protein [Paraflavitalea devenefica]